MLHKWNRKTNQVETLNACKGHKRSVDCIAVDATKSLIASGSYDAQVDTVDLKHCDSAPSQRGFLSHN